MPPAPAHAVLPPGLTRNYTGVMKQNYTLTIIYLLTFLSRFHTHTHTHLLFTWQESSESPTPHPHLTLLCTSNPPYCRSWKEDTHLLTLLLKLTWTPEMPFFLRKEKSSSAPPRNSSYPYLQPSAIPKSEGSGISSLIVTFPPTVQKIEKCS